MKSVLIKAVIVLILFAGVGLAQRKPVVAEPRRDETIRIDTSLVLIDGIVSSTRTKASVGGLSAADFTILENGRPQPITHFSREELPMSVVLLLDVSGSVQPIMSEIRKSALEALGRLKPDDRVATMIFANTPKVIADLTKDRSALVNGLDNLWAESGSVGSGTVINLGVFEAARYLREKTGHTDRRAIILITDDENYRNSLPPREIVLRELYESGTTVCGILVSHRKAARAAVNAGATAAITAVNPILGGVILGMKVLRRATDPGSISKYLSDYTGGITIGARKEDIGRIFVDLMGLLRTRYTFGYEPPDPQDDVKLREVRLTLSDSARRRSPELRINARRGYYLSRLRSQPRPVEADLRVKPAASGPVENLTPVMASYPARLDAAVENPGLPELNSVSASTLSPPFGCQPAADAGQGYRATALFLSDFSRRRNIPELVFQGQCGEIDYFDSATASGEIALIADLGEVPLEAVAAGAGAGLIDLASFNRMAPVRLNHTYAVSFNRPELRGLFFFSVSAHTPNERVDLKYFVRQYQIVRQ